MIRKYLLGFLFGVICICMYLFHLIYEEAKDNAIGELNSRQMIHAEQAKRGIENFFDQLTNLLTTLSMSDHVVEMDSEGKKELTFSLSINPGTITAFSRVDENGYIVYTVPYQSAVIGRDISGQKHIRKILSIKKPVISDVFTSVQGYRAIALHVPVFREDIFRGTLGILIDFQTVSRRFLEDIRLGKTGYAWMTSRDGVELYCPVPGHIGKSVYENCKDFPSILSMADRMLQGRKGITTYSFDRVRNEKTETIKKHAVYLPIRIVDSFWSIVVASAEVEVLANLVSFKNKLISIIGLFLFAIAVFSYYSMKAWGIVREAAERQKAEQELQESRQQLAEIFDMSIDLICIADINSAKFLRVNPAFTRTLGYTEEELLDRPFLHFIHDDDRDDTLRVVREKLQKGEKVIEFINRYRCRNGSYRWLEWASHPIPERGVTFAVAHDITNRRQTDLKLQASELRFRELFDNMSSGVAIYDSPDDGQSFVFKDLNKAGLFYQKKEKQQVIGREVRDVFPGVQDLGLFDVFKRVWKTGIPEKHPSSLYKDDQLEQWVENYVYKLPTGELVAIYEDVTARKKAEQALAKSEERLKLALDSVSDAVWDWNIDTGEVYFSSRWYTMLGYEPYELPQKFETWKNLIHPDDLQYALKTVQEHQASGKPFEIEVRMRTREQNYKWVLARGKTIKAAGNGNGRRMLGTHVDVTERKKMEQRLQQAQKMEAIGTLAGGIAHDFNNILFPLLGFAEMLKEDIPPESPSQAHIDEIINAGLRSRDLVKQILTFSRQGDQDLKLLRLQPIIKEAVKLLRSSIPKTIDIKQNISTDCGPVVVDPTQIHQIIMNLSINAYHAMGDAGGTLSIRLEQVHMELDGVAFPTSLKGDYALVAVSDTGIGIEKDNLHKIFDPYFTTKSKEKGTGLGLSVVQGIVKSYSGDIHVYSEPGKGTEVRVYLPVIERKSTATGMETVLPMKGGTEAILLVDDEQAILRMEQQMLERLGYRVALYTESTEAFKAFKAAPDSFDLVVTDMTMPKMTGVELAAAIKRIRPNIPVILCTGFSEQVNEAKCADLGIEGFVMKPVVRREIAQVIRNALDKTGSGRDRSSSR